MSLTLTPMRIDTGTDDVASQLVLNDGALVAVLVQLSDIHGGDAGRWCLEAGFGRVDHARPPTFAELDEAKAWTTGQLTDV